MGVFKNYNLFIPKILNCFDSVLGGGWIITFPTRFICQSCLTTTPQRRNILLFIWKTNRGVTCSLQVWSARATKRDVTSSFPWPCWPSLSFLLLPWAPSFQASLSTASATTDGETWTWQVARKRTTTTITPAVAQWTAWLSWQACLRHRPKTVDLKPSSPRWCTTGGYHQMGGC